MMATCSERRSQAGIKRDRLRNRDGLKARLSDLAPVARGWQHRTRPKFADVIRQARQQSGVGAQTSDDSQAAPLSPTRHLVLAAVAYHQPIARERVSHPLGRAISRDTIARLKRLGLIGAGPRLPQAGAAPTSMTTPTFLKRFGLTTLRDLPDVDARKGSG
jgi:segregation and condensation protein B